MIRFKPFVLLAAALVMTAAAVTDAAAQRPAPCSDPAHRQFDFWIGEWTVYDDAGQVIGESRIDSIMNGCVITEEWKSSRGPEGRSYSVYDAPNDRWHQTYVDNSGGLLMINGGWNGGAMAMEGMRRGGHGEERGNRITWTPQEDGSVLQLYEGSRDRGATWEVLFEGRYVPRTAGPGQ